MYKYFISYTFSSRSHLVFGNTVCNLEKEITDLDTIMEIENMIKESSIQQEKDEYVRYVYQRSKVTILNYSLVEGK